MTRSILIALAGLAVMASTANAAMWRGHTVRAKLVGQIDASPCPKPSCLRGIVGVFVDGMDVRDHLVRCAWPKHPRVVDFRRHNGHHQAEIRTCGRFYWWRFR